MTAPSANLFTGALHLGVAYTHIVLYCMFCGGFVPVGLYLATLEPRPVCLECGEARNPEAYALLVAMKTAAEKMENKWKVVRG